MVDYDDDLYNLWHNMVQFPGSSFRPLCRCVLHKVLLLLHSTPLWHDAHLVCLLSAAPCQGEGVSWCRWKTLLSTRSVISFGNHLVCVFGKKSSSFSAAASVVSYFIYCWHYSGEDIMTRRRRGRWPSSTPPPRSYCVCCDPSTNVSVVGRVLLHVI